MALVHRRGAGMVGKAFDRYIRVQNADNAFHHADVDLLALQRAALLDVQLKISGDAARLPLRGGKTLGIAADKTCAFANGLTAIGNQVQVLLFQTLTERLAADGSAFFILKGDDLKRMAQSDLLVFERLRNFDGRKRAHITIVVAAHGDRINVRADEDRLERRIASRARADNISRDIDMNIEPRRLHQTNSILAALEIGLRIGHAAHAALRISAELQELFQVVMDALSVHPDRRG